MDQILQHLGSGDYDCCGYGDRGIEPPFSVKPREFLAFAAADHQAKCPHWPINCLSNTKRAISCQVDSLLYAFGMYRKAQKENWNAPQRIHWLQSLAIVAPPILGRINGLRNVLEHEYERPSEDQVETALDVARLFTEYTDRFMEKICHYAELLPPATKPECPDIAVEFDWESGLFTIEESWHASDGLSTKENREVQLDNGDERYARFLALYLKVCDRT